MATIDRYYFHVCTDGARRRGVDVDRLLAEAGIAPDLIDDPAWRGDVEAMARLVRGIWRALADEYMGYTAHSMPLGAFAFAAELAMAGPSVGEGLARAIRFYNLASQDIRTSLRQGEGRCTISVVFAEPQRDPTHYFSEFWLIIWHRLACWLAGEAVPMIEARFDYPRPDAYFEEFKYLFPSPHRFDAADRAIVTEGQAMGAPVRRTREELAAMLDRAPLAMMTIPASDDSLARRVRTMLARDPPLSAAALGAALRLSPDALRRALREEGTGLTRIRENVRRDAAIRELVGTGRSVDAIAAALGYAEPRSFTRAFRQWTGMSPSRYRARHGMG